MWDVVMHYIPKTLILAGRPKGSMNYPSDTQRIQGTDTGISSSTPNKSKFDRNVEDPTSKVTQIISTVSKIVLQ